jgi:hypothetical protein
VLAHALAGDFGKQFTCGVIAHPSVQLENMLWKRDPQQVFADAGKPMLLMPSKVGSHTCNVVVEHTVGDDSSVDCVAK